MKIIFFVLLAIGTLFSCSCALPGTPLSELNSSGTVFAGKVLEIHALQPGGGWYDITFEVTQSWKGVNSSRLTVRTPYTDAMCGFRFERGESYLVYTNANDVTSYQHVSLCSRTRLLANASEDLGELGSATSYVPFPMPIAPNYSYVIPILVLILVVVLIFYKIKSQKNK